MAADRELSISYGGFQVGGVVGTTAGYKLHGFHQVDAGAETASVRFDVVVVADSAESFGARCRDIEAAFSKPFQNLSISLGGTVLRQFSHDSNVGGFDSQPTITKSGTDEIDSGRSRQYTISIDFGVPASAYPTSGLRSREVVLESPPSRRRVVRISGTYTAVSTSSARAMYNAGADSMSSAILSALGVSSSELIEETAGPSNQTDKTIDFERVYEEIIFSQAGATLDDTDIKSQVLRITTDVIAPGDSTKAPSGSGGGFVSTGGTGTSPTTGSVARLAEQRLEYEAHLDSSSTTDLKGKYDAIKSWLVQQMKDAAGTAGSFALVSDAPDYEYDNNVLRVSMRALVATKGQVIFLREITVSDSVDEGVQHDPVWNGDPLAVVRYQGPAIIERTATDRRICQGTKNSNDAAGIASSLARGQGGAAFSSSAGTGKWDEIRRESSVTPRTLGCDPHTIEVTEMTASVTMRAVNPVSSSGGGTGGPNPITPSSGQGGFVSDGVGGNG